MLQYSCMENPLSDREAWQATVYRVAKSWTGLKRPCLHRCKTFFACGSSAPVRVEHEGSAAAWLAGTLAAPSVLGHGLPPPQELQPSQSLLSSLLLLVIRRLLWPVFLCSSTHSGTQRVPLPGVPLCCLGSVLQAYRGDPWLGSYSVDWHVRHLKGHPGWNQIGRASCRERV